MNSPVAVALLDSNILIALASPSHIHHEAAETWWAKNVGYGVATCPITQRALVRTVMREGNSADAALAVLGSIVASPAHTFWADDVAYATVRFDGVAGHRQVTDAYLAQLARQHGGRLATFDEGLAALHPDVAELVPVAS